MADSIKRHNNTVRNDIYISADSAEGGNGSKDMPLSSISQALKMYPEKTNITFHVSGAITESAAIQSSNKDLNLTIEGDGSTTITWNFSSDATNKTCIVLSSGEGSETFNQNVTLKNISLVNKSGSIAQVEGGTLTLDNATLSTDFYKNGTLTPSAVDIKKGGKVVMLSGKIHRSAQGVRIGTNGTFIMESGSIESNGSIKIEGAGEEDYTKQCGNGRGVYVSSGGNFIMNNGAISKNRAVSKREEGYLGGLNDHSSYDEIGGDGGGVYVAKNATFTMNGGDILKNDAINGAGGGGAVYVEGTFYLNSGTISENYSYYGNAAGVCIIKGTIYMKGGKITRNKNSTEGYSSQGSGLYWEVADGVSPTAGKSGSENFQGGYIGYNKVDPLGYGSDSPDIEYKRQWCFYRKGSQRIDLSGDDTEYSDMSQIVIN